MNYCYNVKKLENWISKPINIYIPGNFKPMQTTLDRQGTANRPGSYLYIPTCTCGWSLLTVVQWGIHTSSYGTGLEAAQTHYNLSYDCDITRLWPHTIVTSYSGSITAWWLTEVMMSHHCDVIQFCDDVIPLWR